MPVKFFQDIIPLSDLKVNSGKIVSRAQDNHRPILLTSRGRGVAVLQGLEDYENLQEECSFIRAVTLSLLEIKAGKEQSLENVKKKLGIKT